MTFLPLVERELRVASRRKSTFWIRCGAAILGILFMLPALTMAALSQGRSNAGAYVFTLMSWYGKIGGMVAGAFLGSDCIADERREGTLGFLFLKDLKPIDVVLGKFVGVSLNAFYGALALAPLLGASILAGGVTGGEFWRTTLALLNMLFFATSLSILISARAKAVTRPTMLALTLMILIWMGGDAAGFFSSRIPWPATGRILFWTSLASPGETFSLASDAAYLYRPGDFWESLAISSGIGWLCLGLATWGLNRSIDDQAKSTFRARKSRNRKLLETAPIVWLLDDSRGSRIAVWVLAGVAVAIVVALAYEHSSPFIGWAVWPIYFLLKIRFAVCACRFFAEGRQTGALELLRTTPIAGDKMISEQWAALRRIFLAPVGIIAFAHVMGGLCSLDAGIAGSFGLLGIYKAVSQCADFIAIGWGGMWISLTTRKPARAQWLTILLLVILPAALVCVPDLLIAAVTIPPAQFAVKRRLNAYLAVRHIETSHERAMVRS